MAVNVPVADLRAQPHTTPQPGEHDPLQETQLLYGERVRVIRMQEGWAYVEAIEQPEFTHARRWQGYPGWLPAAALIPWEPLRAPTVIVTDKWASAWEDPHGLRASSWRFPLGTRLAATDVGGLLWRIELLNGATVWMPSSAVRSLAELERLSPRKRRQLILRNAELLLGDPYFWGGRSTHLSRTTTRPAEAAAAGGVEATVTGPDCSGLVNLAYRAAGLDIPRDAQEQSLRARAVATPQPADLVFLSAREEPRRIVHVLLYAGFDKLIEGPGTGLSVRRITVRERLGRRLEALLPGTIVDGQTVRFGTYFPGS
jgi:cell wall-associated NlpC family hydrolase